MREVTCCFFVKGDEVLLAMKKRGFGEGWWNGVGGKPESQDATLEDTAIRESKEEICATPSNLTKVALINFSFDEKPEWDQRMHAYLVTGWLGEPQETEEMKPQWFHKDSLPTDKMWPADRFWIPRVLDGKKLVGEVHFNAVKELLEYDFREVTNLN